MSDAVANEDTAAGGTRWLVTGAGGMLGQEVVAALAADPAAAVTAATRADLDLTDPAALLAAVRGHRIVVNAAAWTDVDGAEADEAAATVVNGDGVRHLAAACAAAGALLIHVSTDYVFPGDAKEPYREDDPTGPVNAYGRGKLAGELAVAELLPDSGYTVRTAWLYGAHGRNFVATMLKLAATHETLDVVDDQLGQPTWARALAVRLTELGRAALAGDAPAGAYHGTAAGQATWYELARAAFELSGLDPERIRPTTADKFVRPAERPAYSVLGHDRWSAAGLPAMADWRDELKAAVAAGTFTAGA